MFLLQIPDEYPCELIGEYCKEISPDRFLFRRGIRLPEDNGVPHFQFSEARSKLAEFDLLPNNTMIPLISERVVALLSPLCVDDYQLIPSVVRTKDGELEGFSLLNIVATVAAIDKEQSSFSFVPGTKQIMKVNRLRCKLGALSGHHIAREADYMSFIWASMGLKKLFESAQIKGCQFLPPNLVHQ